LKTCFVLQGPEDSDLSVSRDKNTFCCYSAAAAEKKSFAGDCPHDHEVTKHCVMRKETPTTCRNGLLFSACTSHRKPGFSLGVNPPLLHGV